MVRKVVLSFIAILGICALAMAQNRQVSGTVTDAEGRPVAGATVMVDGTSVGTTTNADGSFSIATPPHGSLLISFIGYEPQQIPVGSKTRIDVTLQEDTHAIDDVVVLAFGEVKKKDLTGSVGSVSASELAKRTVSSATRALEGAVVGVQTFSSTGQPGSDASIVIRGVGSINAGQTALIVVDGAPYSSALSTINPNDIESITVSKDASANALYGSRAANGVVFVTTKKGRTNTKSNISFEAKWGWNQQAVEEVPTIQNPGKYYEYSYAALYNYAFDGYGGDANRATAWAQNNLMAAVGNYMAYKIPDGSTLIDPATGKLNSQAKLLYADNWDDYLFTKQFRQEYTASISGGNDKIDYYVSMGFLDDPSYTIMSSFKRYTGRAQVNAQATKWLKVGANLAYTRRDIDSPSYSGANTANVFTWTMWQNPLVPYYARDLDGKIRYNPDGTKMLENGMGSTLSPYGETSDMFCNLNGAHPEQSMKLDIFNSIRDNLMTKAFAEITFLKHFKFTANFTMDNIYRTDTQFQNNKYGFGVDTNGFVDKYAQHYTSLNAQQLLSWTQTFKDVHAFDVMIGHEFGKVDDRSMEGAKTNIFLPNVPELSNAITQYDKGSWSETEKTAIEGYLARISYVYDDRYIVTANYRRDGSSRFKYNQWADFWSVGGAWRIVGEGFMSNAHWVNDLKLRASYGTSGNQSTTSAYPYTNLWDVVDNNGQIGVSQATTGNRNLTWEKNKQVDVGIDFRFWDRFYGTVDYYNRRTHSLIWNRPTPASTGLSSRLENVGVLANSGVEVDLGVDIFKRQNLYWNFGVNMAFRRNTLISIPSELGDPYITGGFRRGSGKPYYNLYLYEYAGVNPETGGEQFWADDKDGDGKVIGRKKVDDINLATRYEQGSALPDVVGGFNTSFRWKNFDFSVTAAFQIGGKQWDAASANLQYAGRIGFAISKDLENYWTPQNTNASAPKPYYNGSYQYTSSLCDALFRDASYLSLASVNVGYTLPKRWTSRVGIESLRVFFSGTNLAFVSSHKGFDPRTAFTSMDAFGFPQQSSYTFGITLNL